MTPINSYDFKEKEDIENTRSIEELRLWIVNHLDLQHSLQSLAERSKMNITKMQRLFSRTYGCSIFAYIRIERLLRAQKQLEVTAMNIKSISAEAGYRSIPAFTAAFSATFGETPAKFRKGNKQTL